MQRNFGADWARSPPSDSIDHFPSDYKPKCAAWMAWTIPPAEISDAVSYALRQPSSRARAVTRPMQTGAAPPGTNP